MLPCKLREAVFVPFSEGSGPLLRGKLLDRLDRFVAVIELEDTSEEIRAHCINPGRMEGFVRKGAVVWVQPRFEKLGRATKYTWELILSEEGVVCSTNTRRPNDVAAALLEARALPGLDTYVEFRAEKKIPKTNTRCDFWLKEKDGEEHWLEVKNCHCSYDDPKLKGYGYFPDSITDRGAKHCYELGQIVAEKKARCTVLFVAQRADVTKGVRVSRYHDPAFASAALDAQAKGVSFRAVRVDCDLRGSTVLDELPVSLEPNNLDDDALDAAVTKLRPTTGWTRSFDGTPRRVANGPFKHHTTPKKKAPTTPPSKRPPSSPHFTPPPKKKHHGKEK